MFCPNCGMHIPKDHKNCVNCGYQTENLQSQTSSTEQLASKYKQFIKKSMFQIKTFFKKYKKQITLTGTVCTLFIICSILFFKFYDFTKINWDMTKGDIQIVNTEPTTVSLYVIAYDRGKNPISQIEFKVDGGKIEADGNSVKWILPKETGTYTITASAPSGKKIKKRINVITLNPNSLFGELHNQSDQPDLDLDSDGLTNKEEKQLGTNPNHADSDHDGLTDFVEIHHSKTNPCKADSDEDGIPDGAELDLGLNPLKMDSLTDGIEDGDRELSYTIQNRDQGVVLKIDGTGSISNTTIDILKNPLAKNQNRLLQSMYQFDTEGTMKQATVTIQYDLNEVQSKGISDKDLSLYYWNENNKKLEKVSTIVDLETHTITSQLDHFSKYVVGDQTVEYKELETNILFVIDNSISMYTVSQMEQAGYSNSVGALGNDSLFRRLTLTNKMIDMLNGNYKLGVSEFSGNYVKLKPFTDDKKELQNAVNQMKSKWISNTKGTNIVSALKKGTSEFSSDNSNHYLILLTDGKNTEGSLSKEKETIISQAKNNNVKVCVIGIGSEIDQSDLSNISESTGCHYYHATNASALDEIYTLIGASINYNYIDTDNDAVVDGIIQADSGFLVNRDGFSFKNFRSNKSYNGHCYGMVTFASFYYQRKLPMQLSALDNSKFYISYMKKIDLSSRGYDLNNTYFATNQKLYDYKISNESLSYLLEILPANFRDRVENDTWMIQKKYYDKLIDIGAKISTDKYEGKETGFHKYQVPLLSIDNDTLNSTVSKDDSQLLNAIWRMYILQANDERSSFDPDPDSSFDLLTQNLENGIPQVLSIAGNHAVNATRLIQDISNSNHFKIEIYDNNYPGETRYIDVERTKYNKWQLNYTAWVNEYSYEFLYDTDNDGKKEDISLALSTPILK